MFYRKYEQTVVLPTSFTNTQLKLPNFFLISWVNTQLYKNLICFSVQQNNWHVNITWFWVLSFCHHGSRCTQACTALYQHPDVLTLSFYFFSSGELLNLVPLLQCPHCFSGWLLPVDSYTTDTNNVYWTGIECDIQFQHILQFNIIRQPS